MTPDSRDFIYWRIFTSSSSLVILYPQPWIIQEQYVPQCNVHLKLISISLMISMPARSKREIIVAISLNSRNLPRNEEINLVTLHRDG
jgi:hypothetical protein